MGLFGPPNIDRLKAKGDILGLVKALEYGQNAEVRAAAALALGELRNPSAVEPLLASVRAHPETPEIREGAAYILGRIADPRAIEPLIAMLEQYGGCSMAGHEAQIALARIGPSAVEPLCSHLGNRKNQARWAVAEVLGKIADPRAVEALTAALKEPEPALRQHATEALAKIGDSRAIQPLVDCLADPKQETRLSAASALDALDWKPDCDETAARYYVANRDWAGCAKIGAAAVEPLMRALRGAAWDADIQNALAAIGAPSVEPLVGSLNYGDYTVRRVASEVLVHIGAPAVEPLVAALRHSDQAVRAAAAVALGQIGDERAVDPISVALMHDAASQVRSDAAEALGRMGDERAVGILIGALKDKGKGVREMAGPALVRIGAPSVGPLVAVLGDADVYTRNAAVDALELLGWEPDTREAGAMFWAAKRKWEKCVQIGAPAVRALSAALNHEDQSGRSAVVAALASIGDPFAAEALAVALKDDDLRETAFMALVRVGAPAVGPLVSALADEREMIRRGASRALAEIGSPALDALAACMSDPDHNVRWRAANALGQIGEARARELLLAAQSDSDQYVRQVATEGLARHAPAEERSSSTSRSGKGTEITVDRPPEVVWSYFTEPRNWETWWGGGLIAADWRAGGRVEWALGVPEKIEAITPGQMVVISGRWIDAAWTFDPAGSGRTTVRVEQGSPKGGATFTDGGAASRAEHARSLARLKEQIERQTSQEQRATGLRAVTQSGAIEANPGALAATESEPTHFGLYVFNNSDAGLESRSAERTIFETLSQSIGDDGAKTASLVRACGGDLFEQSYTGGTPGVRALANWLAAGTYGLDATNLDVGFAGELRSGASLGFIPYVVAIGPLHERHALTVHEALHAHIGEAYVGLAALTLPPGMGNVAMELHLLPIKLRWGEDGFHEVVE